MLKYQTLITMAFQDYPVEACIEYDRTFRQLAAKDKNVPWDKYKRGHINLSGASLPNQSAQDWDATIFLLQQTMQLFCHVLAQPQTPSHTHPQELKFASAF